jgi:hypothetical protein
MAMVLQITVSQWSMYKSGLRDIPTEAKNRLTDLLQNAKQENKIPEAREELDTAEAKETQKQLQQDYIGIEIQQSKVAKKISILENTRAECFAALETASFLENQKRNHPMAHLVEGIRLRASKTLREHNLYRLTELQLKQESLELLKNNIAKKIKTEENQIS